MTELPLINFVQTSGDLMYSIPSTPVYLKQIKKLIISILLILSSQMTIAEDEEKIVFKAGHPSLQKWLLADQPPIPKHTYPNQARIELGKKLFFDPRISRDGNMSCATCHNPAFGWGGGGLPTGIGHKGLT